MGLLTFLFGCSQPPALQEGSLYTVDDGEGFYRAAKILALDDQGVHVRLYKNKWKERPAVVDISALSLGSIHDDDGVGLGHLPLLKKAFMAWSPVFVQDGKVTKDELDGYEMWKEGGGGYFGH